MTRIAPRTIYGVDGAGVRRKVPAGKAIPPGLTLEEPLPELNSEPAESKVLRRRTADRRGIKGARKR